MAQLANVEEAYEDALPTLMAEARPKSNLKAPGNYPFPFANNKSKRIPP
jgi:hypothetical protein